MKTKLLITFLIFFAFFIHGVTQLDPDFGWHLRMGQVILSSGIPKTDPFSYSMPSYPFIDLSWLSGVILAWLYPKIGMIGLSFLAALITVLSLIITLSIKFKAGKLKNFYFWAGLLVLSSSAIFPFEAVRIQVISWLFLAIVLKIFLEQDYWEKRRFLLPGLFLLWANLHGSFLAGLVVLGIGILVRSWRIKNLKISDAMILISSALLTLINPYGLNLYGEVARTLWGSNLSGQIMEWMPAIFNFNLPFIALIPVSVLSVWHYRKKYNLEILVLFFGFLVAAIFSQRHIPLWIIICLPLPMNSFHYFALEINRIKFGRERMKKMVIFCFFGCLFLFLTTFLLVLSSGLTENNFYPAEAVKYLKNSLPEGQIFSEYGWGGYLIWKLPEKKVFIDGRMCTWPNIMKDNEAILTGKTNYQTVFQQYGIKVVLWPKARQAGLLEQFTGKILRIFKKEESFNLIRQIEKDGWKKVYEDQVAAIYRLPI
ncbi:hypothetical protein COT44_01590 [Candidatus Shapirobacteria bacterium CG08_land_8_20_14_0_20_39_18]|uniref:Glycosyltransferase RgtA/B/C/D-like domain-containing protein n=1 Tax=Candidatus Shapirobacteria bacterium CG08_land_8_20_14_0_20_39_18 TaxID=1974883 RepID=A0A2M6XDM6_9BACT|nr:MAG: hypothetical protein COT44_01590 [Candidatus Shapirobacteria bacterium CG08_land_8_20_14_0_20_39_18]PIY65163.1 MAG: hypothetical protein COY91_03850 [Candidatus Shapirobacteria bacterium CG_4_10_14_0_8_um_filter_39_15]PJE67949.1 MAG: hypothetical protein COU94_04435 [Candidatus Shapirobacteria bacterium CG10_big_fil_rev_8_21_14_0_10_38_8]